MNTAIGQTGRLLTYSFRQERYGATIAPVKNLLGCGRFSDAVVEGVLEQRKDILVQAYLRGVPSPPAVTAVPLRSPRRGTVDEYSYLSELGIDPEREIGLYQTYSKGGLSL